MASASESQKPGGRFGTGRFSCRRELTCHVWAMHRLQVFPNVLAIARACGVSAGAVKKIIDSGEGAEDYLKKGCLDGA